MAQGPDVPLRVAPFLAEHAHVWDRLVQRHGLRPIAIDALVGESHHYIDALLRANVEQLTPPILVSTEPRRVCRRLFGLSHAAIAAPLIMA
jgi:hypothetical protein